MPAIKRWSQYVVICPDSKPVYAGQTDESGKPPVSGHQPPQNEKCRNPAKDLLVFLNMKSLGSRFRVNPPLIEGFRRVQIVIANGKVVFAGQARVVIDLDAANRAARVIKYFGFADFFVFHRQPNRALICVATYPDNSPHQSLLCEPSHNGRFAVALHPQKNSFLSSAGSYLIGENSVSLCEPSQKG